MNTSTIDLMPFCAESSRNRYVMTDRPWVRDGWKYATDTCLIVRVPTIEPDTPTPAPTQRRLINPLSLPWPNSENYVPSEWSEWPADPQLFATYERCRECGSMHVTPSQAVIVLQRGYRVSFGYHRKLSTLLPGQLMYRVSMGANEPVAVTFDGGQALLAPLDQLASPDLRELTALERERVLAYPIGLLCDGAGS